MRSRQVGYQTILVRSDHSAAQTVEDFDPFKKTAADLREHAISLFLGQKMLNVLFGRCGLWEFLICGLFFCMPVVTFLFCLQPESQANLGLGALFVEIVEQRNKKHRQTDKCRVYVHRSRGKPQDLLRANVAPVVFFQHKQRGLREDAPFSTFICFTCGMGFIDFLAVTRSTSLHRGGSVTRWWKQIRPSRPWAEMLV